MDCIDCIDCCESSLCKCVGAVKLDLHTQPIGRKVICQLDLSKHERLVHSTNDISFFGNDFSTLKGQKTNKCSSCQSMFTSKYYMQKHDCENLFKCDLCDKTFDNERTLKYSHHCGKMATIFSCFVCDKTFSNAQNLKAHQQIYKKTISEVNNHFSI